MTLMQSAPYYILYEITIGFRIGFRINIHHYYTKGRQQDQKAANKTDRSENDQEEERKGKEEKRKSVQKGEKESKVLRVVGYD